MILSEETEKAVDVIIDRFRTAVKQGSAWFSAVLEPKLISCFNKYGFVVDKKRMDTLFNENDLFVFWGHGVVTGSGYVKLFKGDFYDAILVNTFEYYIYSMSDDVDDVIDDLEKFFIENNIQGALL